MQTRCKSSAGGQTGEVEEETKEMKAGVVVVGGGLRSQFLIIAVIFWIQRGLARGKG